MWFMNWFRKKPKQEVKPDYTVVYDEPDGLGGKLVIKVWREYNGKRRVNRSVA